MSGLEFITELQKNTIYSEFAHLPVVIISASTKSVVGRVDAYLRKPFEIAELISVARGFLA
jgi:CheY-like chemotaxis protein